MSKILFQESQQVPDIAYRTNSNPKLEVRLGVTAQVVALGRQWQVICDFEVSTVYTDSISSFVLFWLAPHLRTSLLSSAYTPVSGIGQQASDHKHPFYCFLAVLDRAVLETGYNSAAIQRPTNTV